MVAQDGRSRPCGRTRPPGPLEDHSIAKKNCWSLALYPATRGRNQFRVGVAQDLRFSRRPLSGLHRSKKICGVLELPDPGGLDESQRLLRVSPTGLDGLLA